MHPIYPNLFSPFRIGNIVLKNRMLCPPSDPHYIQCSENFPSETTIMHYASRARNGAAIVTVEGCGLHQFPAFDHHWGWDATMGSAQNAMSQLADAVHFYGSKIFGTVMCFPPMGYDVSTGVPRLQVEGDLADWPDQVDQEIPKEKLPELADQYASLARADKDCGFDGVYIHMSYRMVLTGRMLSPLTNHRTDEYGGSLENRMRFPMMLCRKIKELCGKNFLIEVSISGEETDPNGWKMEDTLRFAKLSEGLVDLIQVRCGDVDPNHPTGFAKSKTPYLYLTEELKKAQPKQAVVAVGGYFDPDFNEEVLAAGKADLISMARAFISNPEYGKLVESGRTDRIVPCIRCNKCHRSGPKDPWLSVCSVNPRWPVEDRTDRLIVKTDGEPKRIAIIGGGIAGLEAAEVSAARGNRVTLYEKSDRLGGLLLHADYPDFKWPIRDFIHYHIRRVEEEPLIDVRLGTAPDPAELEKEQYDAVFAATGSMPNIPPIPGVNQAHVMPAIGVYGREDRLHGKVVVIGGGEVGCETALYLARKGFQVTVLEMGDRLAPESFRVHYYSMFMEACREEPNLTMLLHAACTEIGPDFVAYRDADGKEVRIEAESVVLAAGMKPDLDGAMKYASTGRQFRLIGDCGGIGNIQKAVRSAYTTANTF